jgi:ribosomal-protein-alanine N-acetyltransferase
MLEPNFSPFPELTTTRLLLRRITNEDAEAILAMRSLDATMQYIDREKMQTIEEALDLVKVINDSLENNNGINWAITLKDEPGLLIGTIGFWRMIKPHYRAEIGYMLHPDHWNKGLMKEAIRAVISYGFGPLCLHSIEAHINPGNAASAALLEKTGFIREAYFKEDYYFRGKFIDSAIYSLLVS